MSTIGNQSLGNQSSTDDLRRKAGDVKQSVQELGSVAKQAAGEKIGELRDTASEKMGELRDSASEYYERGRDRMYEAEQTVEDYIREQPLKSVLIAAGVGFVLGACYLRR